MRLAWLALVTLAPFQCAHTPDPNARREDTAGDALWSLAQDFRAHHDEPAARATLTYLVDHYPSSRYASAARDDLASTGAPAPTPTATPTPTAPPSPTAPAPLTR